MLGTALLDSWRSGALRSTLPQNLTAGLIVGIVALPLAMGLSIAVGLPPQHGLYTAIVGGIAIALLGGSPVNVSGPTAAFVVILLPIVEQHGLGGLLISGLLSGLILIGMGLLRVGRFIQYVPYPVVIGFTAGIGTVIAGLQLKDLLGLATTGEGAHFLEKLQSYAAAIGTLQWQEALIGVSTLAVIFLWKRVPVRVPGYLVALLWGTALAALCNYLPGLPDVATIASRFNYSINGVSGQGIPPVVPTFLPPWEILRAEGMSLGFSPSLWQVFIGAAFSIAILGALESLLCAMVADGMTGRRHDPDSELIGQGIGNVIVPFFGGIPATAAIARTALNVRSGGSTPAASFTHAVFLLVAVLFLAPWLSHVPMAAMSAILIAVAWNMSEVEHVLHLLRTAPRPDISVFLVCYGLTVVVDMQVAVAAGMVLAAALFIRRMSELTSTLRLDAEGDHPLLAAAKGVVVFAVEGPLFFGAAHKALGVVTSLDSSVRAVVLDLSRVPAIDATAMVNIRSVAATLAGRGVTLYLFRPRANVEAKLRRFGLGAEDGNTVITGDAQSIR